MDLFHVLSLVGGLSLFLFGMSVMGQALEHSAGSGLRSLLGHLTTGKAAGLLTGIVVTAVIQSSSAATVMVVGFVNSGLMTLRQAIHVIMGANIGTTVTAWLLSLAGIESSNPFVRLLKPTSFTSILALVGIILYLFCRSARKREIGAALLGFATLMFGMEAMSGAVSGLREVEGFRALFLLFQNPLLGVLAGAVLTAIIQSSSASVGILQALAATGQVSYGAAIPIIMGQNIGTCVTAMLSSVGATKNARRAALVHLSFNVIGTAVLLTIFCVLRALLRPVLLDAPATLFGIAVAHTVFNVLCTLLMLPFARALERLVCCLVPDAPQPEAASELDERLLLTPAIALERCEAMTAEMAQCAARALEQALTVLTAYTPSLADSVRAQEVRTDHDEDALSAYLVRLSGRQISANDSAEAARLLKLIGDFERIADHAVNLVESAEELHAKQLTLTDTAADELRVLIGAVREIMALSLRAFLQNDAQAAAQVEPLEQVIDGLKDALRTRHILRMQAGDCSVDIGFIWSDLLTDLERVADHCSNIAGAASGAANGLMLHEALRTVRADGEAFRAQVQAYAAKYALPPTA
jgi:phosphate:Na+ symporter